MPKKTKKRVTETEEFNPWAVLIVILLIAVAFLSWNSMDVEPQEVEITGVNEQV